MKDKINNICSLEIAVASGIAIFVEGSADTLITDAVFTAIDLIPGASLTIEKNLGKAGRSYESNFSGLIRTEIDFKKLYIVRLSFDDGNPAMIIGDPDLPVRFPQANSLSQKSISFAHSSWHYPWRQADLPESAGSGSSGGGI